MAPPDPTKANLLVMRQPNHTIYDRIVGALRAKGRLESERQLCKKIGLSPTYLSQLKNRCKKVPGTTIASDVATMFADEIGVPVEELIGGGAPQQIEGDAYPSRADAVVAARALRFSQRAIDAVCSDDPGWDPGRLWWFRRIEAEEARIGTTPPSVLRNKRPSSGNGGGEL